MDLRTWVAVVALMGVVALVVGVVALAGTGRKRRREAAAVEVQGVVRSVQWGSDDSSVRLGLAWPAPDGSGTREGVWHGGGGPSRTWQEGQLVPLRVGRDDSWVQPVGPPGSRGSTAASAWWPSWSAPGCSGSPRCCPAEDAAPSAVPLRRPGRGRARARGAPRPPPRRPRLPRAGR